MWTWAWTKEERILRFVCIVSGLTMDLIDFYRVRTSNTMNAIWWCGFYREMLIWLELQAKWSKHQYVVFSGVCNHYKLGTTHREPKTLTCFFRRVKGYIFPLTAWGCLEVCSERKKKVLDSLCQPGATFGLAGPAGFYKVLCFVIVSGLKI